MSQQKNAVVNDFKTEVEQRTTASTIFGDKQTNVIQPAGLSGAQHVGLEDPHKPLAARAKKEPESVEAKHGRMKVTNENRSTFRKRSSRALLCCKSPSLRQNRQSLAIF